MNFLEAKNIISPRHAVIPGSNEHKEILNLMRQSGRVFAEDNVPPVSVPLKSRAKFISRPSIPQTTKPVSKRDSAILKMISPPLAQTAQAQAQAPLFWRNKKIASLNITKHGRREKVQVAPEIEGRAGESKESS
jgi:hypothetical protein